MIVLILVIALVYGLVMRSGHRLVTRVAQRRMGGDVGLLALRELKAATYVLLGAESTFTYVWIQSPHHLLPLFSELSGREQFRTRLQRRINRWGFFHALRRGRPWRRVRLTLRVRIGEIPDVRVTAGDTAPVHGDRSERSW